MIWSLMIQEVGAHLVNAPTPTSSNLLEMPLSDRSGHNDKVAGIYCFVGEDSASYIGSSRNWCYAHSR